MVGGIAGGSTFAQEATQMLRSFKWGIGLYSRAWNIAFVDVICRSVANVALCDDIQYVDGDTLCSNFRVEWVLYMHLFNRMDISGTVRASFALYNTMAEVDALVAAVDRVRKMF